MNKYKRSICKERAREKEREGIRERKGLYKKCIPKNLKSYISFFIQFQEEESHCVLLCDENSLLVISSSSIQAIFLFDLAKK